VVAFKNVDEENLSGVSPGMTQDEVASSVGQPVEKRIRTVNQKEYEIWIYPIERFFARKYNPLGYQYYEIVFSEGKVREWNKTNLYSQPQYELERHETPEGVKGIEIFKGES
jgi:competence protein ComGF